MDNWLSYTLGYNSEVTEFDKQVRFVPLLSCCILSVTEYLLGV